MPGRILNRCYQGLNTQLKRQVFAYHAFNPEMDFSVEKRVNSSPQSYLAEEKGRDYCMGMEDRKLSGKERNSSSCSLRTHRTKKYRCHEV